MKKFLIISFCLLSVVIYSQRVITPQNYSYVKFSENKGQWNENVLFRSTLDGGVLFVEKDKLTFNFFDKKKFRTFHEGGAKKVDDLKFKGHAFQLKFLNAQKISSVKKFNEGSDYENFFIGNDSKKWASFVKNYQRVILENIYEGIDYEAISAGNGIKYNFIVHKNSSPQKIQMQYEGVSKIFLKNKELHIQLVFEEIVEKQPYAYQVIDDKIVEVPCLFELKNNVVSFKFPKGYNSDYDLIIDPNLIFAAQSGSTADNFGMTATYDMSGNLISGGTVFGPGYPTTTGAYDITYNGSTPGANTQIDVVLTKYNSSGTNLIASTYFGGSFSEIVTSIVVDENDNVYFYGATSSPDLPMLPTSWDNTFGGGPVLTFVFNGTSFSNGTDIYIAKLNGSLSNLLGVTFIGGSDNDGVNHTNVITTYTSGYGTVTEYPPDSLMFNYGDQYRGEIQLDKNNNVYIFSSTRSSDFPTTSNAFDNTLGGKQDAVLCVFNSNLSNLIFSSYVGGSNNDCGNSLEVTDSLFVYATGGTTSFDFPTTSGAYSTSYNGGKADGFIVKINPFTGNLLRSTYIGTNNYDQSYFVRRDPQNRIYVYGQSIGNMPVIGSVYNNPGRHQFISVLDQQLNSIVLSTVFGSALNKTDISPSAFAIDGCGYIYLSGWGGNIIFLQSTGGMPLMNAIQSTTDGYNFYLMAFSPNLSNLVFGSYFGGPISHEHVDGGTSRFDKCGNIYQSVCAGCGGNQDFPVTPGAWPNTPGNPNHSFNCNNGVFKIDFQNPTATSTATSGCAPLTVQFNNQCTNTFQYQWNLGNGVVTSTSLNPVATYTSAGTYTAYLVINDSVFCKTKDSVGFIINVYPPISASISYSTSCSDSVYFNGNYTTSASLQSMQWYFPPSTFTSNVTSPVFTSTTAGTYTAVLVVKNNYGCKDSVSQVFNLQPFVPVVSSGDTICNGESITLTASGGTNYQWTPTLSVSNPTASNISVSPTVTTIYSVTITDTTYSPHCSKTLTTQIVVNPKPVADFSFTTNSCGGNAYFINLSSNDVTQYYWSFGDGQTSTIANPIVFYTNGGNYNVSLIVTNAYGCTDTIQKPLNIAQPMPVSVNTSTTICLGNSYTLNATGGFAYNWSPSSSLNSYTISNPVATPTTSTTYTVDIFTINTLGDTCVYSLFTSVNISTLSASSVGAIVVPDTILSGQTAQLIALAPTGNSVTWYPSNLVLPYNTYTAATSPSQTTTYTVIINDGFCTKTATVILVVIDSECKESDVFVPNTFTPNGDGNNDVLYVRGYLINEVYFAVYNRWGELVFETNDKHKGWDGKYKGRDADVGVFGYYLKAKCPNGKEIFKKGNVTLIR
ncbi:MAG TPA: PKD domain-containing protein [Bacteroidia bacterium]|nr:PKD domain-containing protein [Bacteroidia bacterium]